MGNWLPSLGRSTPGYKRPDATPTGRSVLISGLVSILGLAAFGAALLWRMGDQLAHEVYDLSKIQAGLRLTRAVVTNLHDRSGRYGYHYYVAYRYQAELPAGGWQEFNDERTVGRTLYDSLAVDREIPIVYAASDPAISRLQAEYPPAWTNYLSVACPGLIGLAFLAGSLVLTRNTWPQWRLACELDESGMVTTARVVKRWKGRSRWSTLYYVAYALGTGQEAQQMVSGSVYNALVEGTPVNVRYLPRDPTVSRLELD